MAENQLFDQKSVLVIRAPLSEDGYASIYFSSTDGRLMTEREWGNLKQVLELASKVCAKAEAMAHSATAGAS